MNQPQKWPHCDDDIKHFIETLNYRLTSELGDQLIGVYLHGSLAMGSYYRPKSDIDLIVVVTNKLDVGVAKNVGISIACVAETRPTIGNVELSVITAQVAKKIPYRTPFEVHYSTDWHDQILHNKVNYNKDRIDTDLPSHLTYILQRGSCLYGTPIEEVFGEVKWTYFMESIMDDLQWILDDEHIIESPYYSILNICRVLQIIYENDGRVHSKDEGGKWGLLFLPEAFHPLIQQALDVYRSSEIISEDQRKTGGRKWDKSALLALRDYAREKVNID